jgi:hypothetical protein
MGRSTRDPEQIVHPGYRRLIGSTHRLTGNHQFEEDIQRNVSPNIVILERRGIFRGREGARELAGLLEQELPNAPYL